MSDTSVKYFHSEIPGAPVLSGTPGAALAVLDACLVTGWGLKSVETLVVASGVATASMSTGVPCGVGQVVLVVNAVPATLNGEWRVTAAASNTLQFAVPGVPDQTATGAITLKIAPAGWATPFRGGNVAVYQQTDPSTSQMFLRVDDTGTTTSRAVGYETMSSVDVGTGPFPTAAQRADGAWWAKSNFADASPRPWFVVADAGLLYFGCAYFAPHPGVFDVAVFGDVASVKSPDAFACVLFGRPSAIVSTPYSLDQLCYSAMNAANVYIARSHSGLAGAVAATRQAPSLRAVAQEHPSGTAYGPPYPNPADGGLYLSPLNIFEGIGQTPATFRGAFSGYYCCPQVVPPGTFATGAFIPGSAALPGRDLLVVQSYYSPSTTQTSFIDITGPWR